ncbi:MAG TPA: TetR/AcrR family transcriptional regulator [Steroidobacteraceae bacterium]|nr:TetR/AcrR family transcriptional regulator [Steroidobacteraceae bacterium]
MSSKQSGMSRDDEGSSGAPPAGKTRVRDRIFDTACELFYRRGIHGVGVDAIAAEAGSNKMSFYRSFASKDALVTEYLREQEREYWVWWDSAVARHPGEPRRQIEALFEAQLEFANTKTCRGCALGNAAVEITDEEDALSNLVRDYKERVRRRLHELAGALEVRDPEGLGDALMLLMDGGYFTRLVFPGASGPIAAALPAARALIDAYLQASSR